MAKQNYNAPIFFRVNDHRVLACSIVKAESQDTCLTSQDAVEHAQKMKKDLLEKLEQLAEDLPPNTLDELIDELGGPDNVAEVQTPVVGFCVISKAGSVFGLTNPSVLFRLCFR